MKTIATCLLVVLGAIAEDEKQNALQAPSPAEVLHGLRAGHPRLIALESDFAEMKKRLASDPKLKEWQKKLEGDAQKILSLPPSKYEISGSTHQLLAVSRQVLHRVETLSILYRLDGEEKYAQRCAKELEAAALFEDWNPQSFLDTAEMTRAFALGYDWLYDFWTAEQRARLRTAMVEKGLRPAIGCYRGTTKYRHFSKLRNNWNQVCNGGIGLGALALADEEPELAGEIINAAVKSLPTVMDAFAPDGAWEEGPSYWNYATDYNVAFLAALQTALGTDFDLSKEPGFAETGLYPIYMTGPLGLTMNYSDASDGRLRAPQLFWLASKFKRPEYARFEREMAEPRALDLIWYEPVGERLPDLQLDKYFRGVEVATFRSVWNDHEAIFAGFKAGDNQAVHGHLDLGSFVLDALGKRWALDIGGDDYGLPGYFGAERASYYRLRAEGHNTLVINPGPGPDQNPTARAKIVRFKSIGNRAYAIADLTPAYAPVAESVRRGIALLDRKSLLVEDELVLEKPGDVWWFMHTRADIEIDKEGRSAILKEGKIRLLARLLSPDKAAFTVMAAEPLPSSPHPERQAKNEGIRKLAIHVEKASDLRLAVLFVPLRRETSAKEEETQIIPLDTW